jgi:amino-acid N-acetyltransferase
MTHTLVDIARGKGAGALYLLTTTARDFFAALGWRVVDRREVPEVIKATAEYSRLCPDSATCMRLDVQAG